MGYSAARYGHVMFPENVYEPALHCAELLLEGVGKGQYFFLLWDYLLYFSLSCLQVWQNWSKNKFVACDDGRPEQL